MKWAALGLLIPATLLAQQRDIGPPVPSPVGSAEISGAVVSADATPQPIRRAVVTLTGGIPNPRSVVTDDAGRFVFTGLPAGTYAVTARKAAYIAAPYGSRKPGRAGMPVVLADGQRANLSITMFRGAAIMGVLRDASGSPLGSVDVRVIDARTLLTMPDSSPAELATTDDRGVFRIFGLLPGDYFVVALPQPLGQGEVVAPTSAHIDAALAMLSGRNSVTQPPSQVLPQTLSPIGFAPIYFPGTPHHDEAARVHVEAGEERSGVNFEMRSVPMTAIEGVVSGEGQGLSVTLIPSGPRVMTGMSSNSLSGRPIDAQGRFRYSNLPPGRYRIVARARRGPAETGAPTVVNNVAVIGTGRGGTPATGSAGTPQPDYLYGVADVELRGEEVTNVSLSLQPGGVVSGRIVFAGTGPTAKPADLSKMRAVLSLEGGTGMVSSNGLTMGTGLISNPISSIKPDGSFEIRGIGPGRFILSASFPSPAEAGGWKLRSARAGDRDLLDGPIEMGLGMEIGEVVITFSDARTEISGSLQTSEGQPTAEYYIVAMSTDRSFWRPKSRRVLSVRPSSDGRFVFPDLPAGEYLIAALTDLDPIDLAEATFLEQLAPAAIKVTVVEGQKTVQDLRIK